MRYAIYCRKSTDTEDKQVLSLESQQAELLTLAKRENLDISTIISESMSAKEPGRPEFNRLIRLVASGKIEAILCWKIDRLTRNPIDGGQIQWLLQKGSIKCIRTFEKCYYPNDNVLLINIEQAMATQYIRELSSNVKRGIRSKLERGEWPSQAPFGYLNDKANKTIIVDKDRSHYITQAFQLYSTGKFTVKQLTEKLYQKGLRSPTGGKIYKSKIHRVLQSKFYVGLMERYNKLYKGKHEPLVQYSTFCKTQEILQGRIHSKPKKHFYHARGFFTCAECGCVLTADTKRGHIYYYCTNGKGICTQHKSYLRSEDIDQLAVSLLEQLQFDPKLVEMTAIADRERKGIHMTLSRTILQNLTNEAKLLEEKELMLVEGYTSKIISEAAYMTKIKEIHLKHFGIAEQTEKITESLDKSDEIFEQVNNLFLNSNKAAHAYTSAKPEAKRHHLFLLLSNVTIKDKKIVSYQFKKPFDIIAKASKNCNFLEMLCLWDDIRTALLENPGVPIMSDQQFD